jgi:AraC-like DNA-binding protein
MILAESISTSQTSLGQCSTDWPLLLQRRDRRLRAVHGAILAEGNRRSITDIAMSFGFWHLGRFSGGYAALFGCVPTETRRRVWGEFEDEALAPPVSPAAEAEPRKSRDRGAARVTPW